MVESAQSEPRHPVLIVDDDVESDGSLRASLPPDHHVVVSSGSDGVKKALELQPDLILADAANGPELVRALREHRELDAMPIVLVMRKDDDELRVRVLCDGANDVVTKPFLLDELRARVANLLARKRAQDALRASEARLARIVSIAADAIVSIDAEQRIVMYNEGAETIFGWSAAEALGKPVDLLIPKGLRESHRRHVRRFADAQEHTRRMGARGTITGLRKDGTEFPAEASISRLDDAGARLYTVILRDTSDRIANDHDERLRARLGMALTMAVDLDDRLQALADVVLDAMADVAIVDFAEEGGAVRRVLLAHRDPEKAPVLDELRELPLDERGKYLSARVLGTGQPELVSEVTPAYLESVARDAEHLRLLRALTPRSLLALPFVARGRPLGALVLLRTHDARPFGPRDLRVGESVAYRAALALDNARLYHAAQQATRARDEVLAVVAHDLRNPLNGILLHAQRLKRRGSEPERRDQDARESIERAARRMNGLIQDLLDVAKVESGQLSLRLVQASPLHLVSDVVEAHEALFASSGIELTVDAAPDLPDLRCDRDRVFAVLDNLIGNARKFTRAGGRVTVRAAVQEAAVLFTVSDTGSGISAADLPRIFDRYWQSAKGDRRGAGLGLAIAKGIVEAHGGRIWAESTEGAGTTFSFALPRAP